MSNHPHATEDENNRLRAALAGVSLALQAMQHLCKLQTAIIRNAPGCVADRDIKALNSALDTTMIIVDGAQVLAQPFYDAELEKQLGAAFNPASRTKQ